MMRELGLIDSCRASRRCRPQHANPLYLAYARERFRATSFEPVAAKPTLASAIQIGNPVSLPKAVHALVAIRRRGRAGERGRARRRGGARRSHRPVHGPHTGVALAVSREAGRRKLIRPQQRRGHLDRARATTASSISSASPTSATATA